MEWPLQTFLRFTIAHFLGRGDSQWDGPLIYNSPLAMVRHDEIAVLANGVTPGVMMELYEVAIMRGYGFAGDGAWGYFHVMKHSTRAPAHPFRSLQEHTQCFWASA